MDFGFIIIVIDNDALYILLIWLNRKVALICVNQNKKPTLQEHKAISFVK